jgi:hypothetical protein
MRARAGLLCCAAVALVGMCATALAADGKIGNWKITNTKDELTEATLRYATTYPKQKPIQFKKPINVELIMRCGSVYKTGPTHPEIMIYFSGTVGIADVRTRWRFDDGPVEDMTLGLNGTKEQAIFLPDMTGINSVAAIQKAQRLRAQLDLTWAGFTLLEFNVVGSAEAIKAINCH